MVHSWAAMLSIISAAAVLVAQETCYQREVVSQVVSECRCGAHQKEAAPLVPQPYAAAPFAPSPSSPQAALVGQQAGPAGAFVQPPPLGAVRGPVNQWGIEGPSITLPEITLRLPSLRLPSVSRWRSGARMQMESQAAPYVETAPSLAGVMPGPMLAPSAGMPAYQAAPAAPEPIYAPQGPPLQAVLPPTPQYALANPQPALTLSTPQAAPVYAAIVAPPAPHFAPPSTAIPQAGLVPSGQPAMVYLAPATPPQPPAFPSLAPSCDRGEKGAPPAAFEEHIRRVEECERRLKEQMDLLEQCLNRLQTTQGPEKLLPPGPTPDVGPIQKSSHQEGAAQQAAFITQVPENEAASHNSQPRPAARLPITKLPAVR